MAAPEPLTGVREISHVAYGFIASKALFAALHLDLFTHISDGHRTVAGLSEATKVAAPQLKTLLAALTSLGLIVVDGEEWRNSPAAERYLVRGAAGDFGDYYRYQIDQQIYPMLIDLRAGLLGAERTWSGGFAEWMADSAEAAKFSRSQHAGSLGPAIALARAVDLGEPVSMLDVGGGSGAFSIALCKRYPNLTSTILDFPRVCAVGRGFVQEAGLEDRIAFLPGDAREVAWPAEVDVVLMSYLLSAVAGDEIDGLLERARDALAPGGRLLIHDFMLDDDHRGPAGAALWLLSYVANSSGTVSFSSSELIDRLGRLDFTETTSDIVIPEITNAILARRAG